MRSAASRASARRALASRRASRRACTARGTEAAFFFAYGRAVSKRRKYPRMRRAARPRLARGRTMPREGSLSAAVATDLRTGLFPGGRGVSGVRARAKRGRRTGDVQPTATGAEREGLRDRAGARARRTLGTTGRGGFSRASRVAARSRPSRNAAGRRSGGEATRRARGAAKHLSPDSKKCERPESRPQMRPGGDGAETHLGVRARTAGGAASGRRGDRGGCGHGSRHRTRDSRVPEGSEGHEINGDSLRSEVRYFVKRDCRSRSERNERTKSHDSCLRAQSWRARGGRGATKRE